MPIDIDLFEDPDARDGVTTAERVVRFLAANVTAAYTRREIAEAIDADPETVGTNLTRLKHRGVVRHREPHWALTDDTEHVRTFIRDRYGERALGSLRTSASRPVCDDRRQDDEPAADPHDEEATSASGHRRVAAAFADHADYAAVDDRLLDLAYDVQLDTGVRVEVHPVRASEFADRRARGEPFVRTVVAEGELLA